ncbi:alpha,Alpha-Phosphotrehalase [Arthrobacter sp. Hiyo4]|nr:alpha,Alpha-Phosphotrehalase [Arthrobacter sp. Hiyo4]
MGGDRQPGGPALPPPGSWQSVTNFGDTAVDLPAGTVLVSSAPLVDGKLGANSTAWLR